MGIKGMKWFVEKVKYDENDTEVTTLTKAFLENFVATLIDGILLLGVITYVTLVVKQFVKLLKK